MFKSTKLRVLFIGLALGLLLTACQWDPNTGPSNSGDSPAALAESAEPTPINETPVNKLAEIVGTWTAQADLGNYFMKISPQGEVKVAATLERLESGSTDSWRIWMESGQVLADGYALCSGELGSYLAGFYDDGSLKFTAINDSCSARYRMMDRSLPGRLNEYILLYTRVD